MAKKILIPGALKDKTNKYLYRFNGIKYIRVVTPEAKKELFKTLRTATSITQTSKHQGLCLATGGILPTDSSCAVIQYVYEVSYPDNGTETILIGA